MRPAPATALVVGMFGSFALILTVMVLLVRSSDPQQDRVRVSEIRAPAASSEPKPDTPARAAADSASPRGAPRVTARKAVRKSVSEQAERKPPGPKRKPRGGTAAPPKVGRELQQKLEQEQKEMRLLKSEMEKRLRAQVAQHRAKLLRLARNCESLPPGEAAQALVTLDDATISAVLGRMDRQKALGIAAILQRLGRTGATAF